MMIFSRFKYVWHEITEKGFMFAMPWRWKGLGLNDQGAPMPNSVHQVWS